jgi:hypothetical protein
MRLLQQAEQVAREVAPTRPGLDLRDIQLIDLPSGPVFVISIESSRVPNAEDVARFEGVLRERLGEPRLHVVVRKTLSVDVTAKGHILLGAAHLATGDAQQEERRSAVERTVRDAIAAQPGLFPSAVDAVRDGDGWRVRAEVAAATMPSPQEVKGIEESSSRSIGEPVRLAVWARAELQVTADGYAPLGD